MKKFLSIRSNLVSHDFVGIKVVFIERSKLFFANTDYCKENAFKSPVYDPLVILVLMELEEKSWNLVYV